MKLTNGWADSQVVSCQLVSLFITYGKFASGDHCMLASQKALSAGDQSAELLHEDLKDLNMGKAKAWQRNDTEGKMKELCELLSLERHFLLTVWDATR